jgi:hypothetical protein
MQKRPETENVSTRFESHRTLFFFFSTPLSKQNSTVKRNPLKKRETETGQPSSSSSWSIFSSPSVRPRKAPRAYKYATHPYRRTLPPVDRSPPPPPDTTASTNRFRSIPPPPSLEREASLPSLPLPSPPPRRGFLQPAPSPIAVPSRGDASRIASFPTFLVELSGLRTSSPCPVRATVSARARGRGAGRGRNRVPGRPDSGRDWAFGQLRGPVCECVRGLVRTPSGASRLVGAFLLQTAPVAGSCRKEGILLVPSVHGFCFCFCPTRILCCNCVLRLGSIRSEPS